MNTCTKRTHREFFTVCFDGVSELEKQTTTRRCIHLSPRRLWLERLCRGFHSSIHILSVSFLDPANFGSLGGVHHAEGSSRECIDELVVDEKLQ